MRLTQQEILKLAVAIMYRGLLIDLAGAVIFFAAGHFVRQGEYVTPVQADPLNMMGYGLVAVSAVEILLVVLLKRKWIASTSPQLRAIKERGVFYRHLKLLFTILYLVALTPSLYGFLYYILGGSERMFVVMLALTLVGYMLVRIRPDGLERAVGDFELEDPG